MTVNSLAAVPAGAPTVSIIVPVYDAEATLERCAESILSQEYRDFELILVDDGSSDGSPAICDRIAAVDARVRVIHQANAGVSRARNAALDVARGTYVQFADADDWIAADATKLLVRAAERHGADMVICDFFRVVGKRTSHKGDIDAEGPITREEYADYMLEDPANYYYGVLWNKLFRRDVIETYGLRMDPALSWCEDFIFDMEYVLHVERIYPLRVPLYYYVKTEGSLVAQGMNVPDIVRMKLNVIEYYADFYRRVYDERDYRARRLDIYRFLVDYPKDDAAAPVVPGTKKLGRERAPVRCRGELAPGPLTDAYYARKYMGRAFDAIAARFDLEPADVAVFAYVKAAESAHGLREIADFCDISAMAAAASASKLVTKRLLRVHAGDADAEERITDRITRIAGTAAAVLAAEAAASQAEEGDRASLGLGSRAGELARAIDDAERDFDSQRFAGCSPAEVARMRAVDAGGRERLRRLLTV